MIILAITQPYAFLKALSTYYAPPKKRIVLNVNLKIKIHIYNDYFGEFFFKGRNKILDKKN